MVGDRDNSVRVNGQGQLRATGKTVTLAGGSWPDNLSGSELTIDQNTYRVISRDSDTQLTLKTNVDTAEADNYSLDIPVANWKGKVTLDAGGADDTNEYYIINLKNDGAKYYIQDNGQSDFDEVYVFGTDDPDEFTLNTAGGSVGIVSSGQYYQCHVFEEDDAKCGDSTQRFDYQLTSTSSDFAGKSNSPRTTDLEIKSKSPLEDSLRIFRGSIQQAVVFKEFPEIESDTEPKYYTATWKIKADHLDESNGSREGKMAVGITWKIQLGGTLYRHTTITGDTDASLASQFQLKIQGDSPDREDVKFMGVERLVVHMLGGQDKLLSIDTSIQTVVHTGDDADSIEVGQVQTIPDRGNADLYNPAGIPIVDKAHLSDGNSAFLYIYGGDGDDYFEVSHNAAKLFLYGEADNDTFVLHTFLVLKENPDDPGSISNLSRLFGGSGSNRYEYLQNAPVAISGGSGIDTVVINGTPIGDIFVVTEKFVAGAGRFTYFTGVEKLEINAGSGADEIYVLGSPPHLEVIVRGGPGNDEIHLGGDHQTIFFDPPEFTHQPPSYMVPMPPVIETTIETKTFNLAEERIPFWGSSILWSVITGYTVGIRIENQVAATVRAWYADERKKYASIRLLNKDLETIVKETLGTIQWDWSWGDCFFCFDPYLSYTYQIPTITYEQGAEKPSDPRLVTPPAITVKPDAYALKVDATHSLEKIAGYVKVVDLEGTDTLTVHNSQGEGGNSQLADEPFLILTQTNLNEITEPYFRISSPPSEDSATVSLSEETAEIQFPVRNVQPNEDWGIHIGSWSGTYTTKADDTMNVVSNRLAGSVNEKFPRVPGKVMTTLSEQIFTGDPSLSSIDDFYNNHVLRFTSGDLAGKEREITDYTGETRTFELNIPFSNSAWLDSAEFELIDKWTIRQKPLLNLQGFGLGAGTIPGSNPESDVNPPKNFNGVYVAGMETIDIRMGPNNDFFILDIQSESPPKTHLVLGAGDDEVRIKSAGETKVYGGKGSDQVYVGNDQLVTDSISGNIHFDGNGTYVEKSRGMTYHPAHNEYLDEVSSVFVKTDSGSSSHPAIQIKDKLLSTNRLAHLNIFGSSNVQAKNTPGIKKLMDDKNLNDDPIGVYWTKATLDLMGDQIDSNWSLMLNTPRLNDVEIGYTASQTLTLLDSFSGSLKFRLGTDETDESKTTIAIPYSDNMATAIQAALKNITGSDEKNIDVRVTKSSSPPLQYKIEFLSPLSNNDLLRVIDGDAFIEVADTLPDIAQGLKDAADGKTDLQDFVFSSDGKKLSINPKRSDQPKPFSVDLISGSGFKQVAKLDGTFAQKYTQFELSEPSTFQPEEKSPTIRFWDPPPQLSGASVEQEATGLILNGLRYDQFDSIQAGITRLKLKVKMDNGEVNEETFTIDKFFKDDRGLLTVDGCLGSKNCSMDSDTAWAIDNPVSFTAQGNTVVEIAKNLANQINAVPNSPYTASVSGYLDFYAADVSPIVGKPFEDTVHYRGEPTRGYQETGFQLYGYHVKGRAGPSPNQRQHLTLVFENGGTFSLTLAEQTTDTIDYIDNGATMKDRIQAALNGIGSVDATVNEIGNDKYEITFAHTQPYHPLFFEAQKLKSDDADPFLTVDIIDTFIVDQDHSDSKWLYEDAAGELTTEDTGTEVIVVTGKSAGSPLYVATNGTLTTSTASGVKAIQVSQTNATIAPLYHSIAPLPLGTITTFTSPVQATKGELEPYNTGIMPIDFDADGNKALETSTGTGFQVKGYQQYGYWDCSGTAATTKTDDFCKIVIDFNHELSVPLYYRALTSTDDYSEGTITVAAGTVTLTGAEAAWPVNLSGAKLTIAGNEYDVSQRVGTHELTLADPNLTVTDATEYTLTYFKSSGDRQEETQIFSDAAPLIHYNSKHGTIADSKVVIHAPQNNPPPSVMLYRDQNGNLTTEPDFHYAGKITVKDSIVTLTDGEKWPPLSAIYNLKINRIEGQVTDPTSTTKLKGSPALSAQDGFYNNWTLRFTSGDLKNETAKISNYVGAYQAGTITVAEGTVTLEGGSWPDNLSDSKLTIEGVEYDVSQRVGTHELTLTDNTLTVTDATEYTLTTSDIRTFTFATPFSEMPSDEDKFVLHQYEHGILSLDTSTQLTLKTEYQEGKITVAEGTVTLTGAEAAWPVNLSGAKLTIAGVEYDVSPGVGTDKLTLTDKTLTVPVATEYTLTNIVEDVSEATDYSISNRPTDFRGFARKTKEGDNAWVHDAKDSYAKITYPFEGARGPPGRQAIIVTNQLLYLDDESLYSDEKSRPTISSTNHKQWILRDSNATARDFNARGEIVASTPIYQVGGNDSTHTSNPSIEIDPDHSASKKLYLTPGGKKTDLITANLFYAQTDDNSAPLIWNDSNGLTVESKFPPAVPEAPRKATDYQIIYPQENQRATLEVDRQKLLSGTRPYEVYQSEDNGIDVDQLVIQHSGTNDNITGVIDSNGDGWTTVSGVHTSWIDTDSPPNLLFTGEAIETISVSTGEGIDTWTINNTEAHATLNTGGANDTVTVGNPTGRVYLYTEAGEDEITINSTASLGNDYPQTLTLFFENDGTFHLELDGKVTDDIPYLQCDVLVSVDFCHEASNTNALEIQKALNGLNDVIAKVVPIRPDEYGIRFIQPYKLLKVVDAQHETSDGDPPYGQAAFGGYDYVNAGSENDTIRVEDDNKLLKEIKNTLRIDGGDGVDILYAIDTESASGAEGTLYHDRLTGLGMPYNGIYYNTIETLHVNLGKVGNDFTIESTSATTTTHLATNQSLTSSGGNDLIEVKSVAGETHITTRAGNDEITISDDNKSLAGIGAVLTVDVGMGNGDRLVVDNSGPTSGQDGELRNDKISGLGMAGEIRYSNFEFTDLTLGKGGDELDIFSMPDVTNHIKTAGGQDRVMVHAYAGQTILDTGNDVDTITVFDGQDDHAEPRSQLTIDGGQQADTYNLNAAPDLAGISFIKLNDCRNCFGGGSGDDKLYFTGTDLKDVIQLDTVYDPFLDPTSLFDQPRWPTYGNHGDGLIITHFDSGNDFSQLSIDEIDNSNNIFNPSPTNLTLGENRQIVNYSSIDTTWIRAGKGNDTILADDNAAQLHVWGQEGDDQFLIGTVLDSQLVLVDGRPVAIVPKGGITNGTSHPATFSGGDDNDYFEIKHTTAPISVFGDNGDDIIFVKSLLEINPNFDLVPIESKKTTVSGVSGEGSEPTTNDTREVDSDTLRYVQNANIKIDGGAGFDSVIVSGTVLSDKFYVFTETVGHQVGKVVSTTGSAHQINGDDSFSLNGQTQSLTDSHLYKGMTLRFTDGDLKGHERRITNYTADTTGKRTFHFAEPFPETAKEGATFEIFDVVQRIYGAGSKLTELLNIERILLLTGPGDDHVHIYGVDLGPVSDLFVKTGTGSDTVYIGGKTRKVPLSYPKRKRTNYTRVEGYQVGGPTIQAEGLLPAGEKYYEFEFETAEPNNRVLPYSLEFPPYNDERDLPASQTVDKIVSPVRIDAGEGLLDKIIFNNQEGPQKLTFENRELLSHSISETNKTLITPLSDSTATGDSKWTDLISSQDRVLPTTVRDEIDAYLRNWITFEDTYHDPGLIDRLSQPSELRESITIEEGVPYAVFQDKGIEILGNGVIVGQQDGEVTVKLKPAADLDIRNIKAGQSVLVLRMTNSNGQTETNEFTIKSFDNSTKIVHLEGNPDLSNVQRDRPWSIDPSVKTQLENFLLGTGYSVELKAPVDPILTEKALQTGKVSAESTTSLIVGDDSLSVDGKTPEPVYVDGETSDPDSRHYVGLTLRFTSGKEGVLGEQRKITDYTGATRKFVFATPFSSAPQAGDEFELISTDPFVDIEKIVDTSKGRQLPFEGQYHEFELDNTIFRNLIGVSLVSANKTTLDVRSGYVVAWSSDVRDVCDGLAEPPPTCKAERLNTVYNNDTDPRIYFRGFDETELNLNKQSNTDLLLNNDQFKGKTTVQGGSTNDTFRIHAIAGQTILKGGAGNDNFAVGDINGSSTDDKISKDSTVDEIKDLLVMRGEAGTDGVTILNRKSVSSEIEIKKQFLKHETQTEKNDSFTKAIELTITDDSPFSMAPDAGDGFEISNANDETVSGTVIQATPRSAKSFRGSPDLSAKDGFYNNWTLRFTSGDLANKEQIIGDYTGTTKTFTFYTENELIDTELKLAALPYALQAANARLKDLHDVAEQASNSLGAQILNQLETEKEGYITSIDKLKANLKNHYLKVLTSNLKKLNTLKADKNRKVQQNSKTVTAIKEFDTLISQQITSRNQRQVVTAEMNKDLVDFQTTLNTRFGSTIADLANVFSLGLFKIGGGERAPPNFNDFKIITEFKIHDQETNYDNILKLYEAFNGSKKDGQVVNVTVNKVGDEYQRFVEHGVLMQFNGHGAHYANVNRSCVKNRLFFRG